MGTKTLRLAEMLEDDCLISGIGRREHLDYRINAAAELRRLHAVEQERDRLRGALERIWLASNVAHTRREARAALEQKA